MNLTELLNMEIGERRITSSDCRADDITEIIRVVAHPTKLSRPQGSGLNGLLSHNKGYYSKD